MPYQLKNVREKKKITQNELSSISGVSRATIARIESREEVSTSTDTLFKLANALHCKISDIFLP